MAQRSLEAEDNGRAGPTLPENEVPIKPKRVDDSGADLNDKPEDVSGDRHDHDLTAAQGESLDREDIDDSGRAMMNTQAEQEDNTERSESCLLQKESGDEDFVDADNVPTESPSGLPLPKQAGDEGAEQVQRSLPTDTEERVTDLEQHPDTASASQPSQKQAGILGIDYLTSRSLAHRRQVSGERTSPQGNESDWPFRSPYSID